MTRGAAPGPASAAGRSPGRRRPRRGRSAGRRRCRSARADAGRRPRPPRRAAHAGGSASAPAAVVRVWIAAKVSAPMPHVAQADAGEGGRHHRGALDVAALAVLVDHRAQRRRLSAAAVQKVTRALRAGRDLQPHARTPPPDRGRCRAARSRRPRAPTGGSSKAASGWLASRLRPSQRCRSTCSRRPRQRRLGLGDEVGREHALVGGQAGLALEHQRLVRRPATRRSRTGSGTPDAPRRRAASASETSNDDISSRSSIRSPRLRRTTRRNSMSSSGLTQTVVSASTSDQTRAEPGPVAVEAGVIVRRRGRAPDAGSARPARGCRSQRRWKKLPKASRRASSRERDTMSRPQRLVPAPLARRLDGVAAVRQQVGRLDRRHARAGRRAARPAPRLLQRSGGELAGGSCSRGTSRGARSCSSEATASMRASPMPQRRGARVEQDVGEGDDAHALVVRHEGLDPGHALGARLARRACSRALR